MAAASPILHILAGPNGAGKTTLYEAQVQPLTDAPFVNADRLAARLDPSGGRTGPGAGEWAARRADGGRREPGDCVHLLAPLQTGPDPEGEGSRLPSARPPRERRRRRLPLARVAAREARGGHPAPEADICGRYERNQPLIREAVRMADRARVFDNSVLGRPPRPVISFVGGRPKDVAADLPAWAAALYAKDLA